MPMPLRYRDHQEEWVRQYESGLSVWKIGADCGIKGQVVHRYLRRAGVSCRSGESSIRKNPIDCSRFQSPPSPEDAYWLGLLYADGSIVVASKTGFDTISLTAHRDDVESISGFLGHLGLIGPIRFRKDKKSVSTLVTSKTIALNLRALGMYPNKTHSITFPDFLTTETIPHFVRGYFDGDGCAHFRIRPRYVTPQGSISFTGNPIFIEALAVEAYNGCGVRVSGRSRTGKDKRTLSISFEGRNQLIRLYSWLYGSGGSCLSRKKNTLTKGLNL